MYMSTFSNANMLYANIWTKGTNSNKCHASIFALGAMFYVHELTLRIIKFKSNGHNNKTIKDIFLTFMRKEQSSEKDWWNLWARRTFQSPYDFIDHLICMEHILHMDYIQLFDTHAPLNIDSNVMYNMIH